MNLSNKLEIEYEYNGKKLKSNSSFIVVKEKSKDETIEVNHNIFITKENENIYEIKLNNSTKFSEDKAGEILINLDIKR